MSNESNQWIPLTGPGGRLPTEADADSGGFLYALTKQIPHRAHWNNIFLFPDATHFCPIPKAPPLPKPVEKTQRDKDWDKYLSFGSRDTTNREDILDAVACARSDGRFQLAREALGLFDFNADTLYLLEIAYEMERIHKSGTAKAVQDLYALLTKAAEGTP